MDVQQVLHMNGGEGETSYANNSFPQRFVMSKTKPFIGEAILEFFSATAAKPKRLNIADLGCSSGPNSLLAITMILDATYERCQSSGFPCPEFQIFLNDLPANDFNTIFQTNIPSFYKKLREEKGDGFGPCFISAMPGSFYGRLFPSESLHIVYSANSLHWLSQVPPVLGTEKSYLNKGNIALGKTSPPVVFKAYLEQFRRDFTIFLSSRSQEIVPKGRMVISMLGRRIIDPFADECHYIWDDLANVLIELVAEGIVDEAKMDSFNMPYYEPHTDELRDVIQAEGSFDITQLEALSRAGNTENDNSYSRITPKVVTNCLRAVSEPLIASHFGRTMIDKLFTKLEAKWLHRGTRKNVFLVVSLARK